MKISEIITDKYKLRMPPTVYYELLADVVEAEEEQEPVLDKIRAEIEELKPHSHYTQEMKNKVLKIIDKYMKEGE